MWWRKNCNGRVGKIVPRFKDFETKALVITGDLLDQETNDILIIRKFSDGGDSILVIRSVYLSY